MKKYLSIMCAVALFSALFGCSNKSDTNSSTESTIASENSFDETTTEESSESTAKTTTAKTTEATAKTSTIETITEEKTEVPDEPQASIVSTAEFVSAIGQQIEITDIVPMAAEMIGAVEGTSFKYNGNKFEIYRYNENDEKLTEALSGTLTYTIEGFGDFSSNASVNENYVMIYNTADDTVIQTFLNVE